MLTPRTCHPPAAMFVGSDQSSWCLSTPCVSSCNVANYPGSIIRGDRPSYLPSPVSVFASTSLLESCAWNSSFKLSTTLKSASVFYSVEHISDNAREGVTLTIVPIVVYQLLESAGVFHLWKRALLVFVLLVHFVACRWRSFVRLLLCLSCWLGLVVLSLSGVLCLFVGGRDA